ncbi:MAG: hypothetical protein ACTSRK_00425 [Promethearchaeota archaeon]
MSTDVAKSTKFKTVVKTLSIIAIVATSTILVGINQNWFDFGSATGIFPVISSPGKTDDCLVFKEGYPINFKTTVYMVDNGNMTSNSIDNFAFRDDLNITWYLKRDGWNNFYIIDSGSGLTEFTTSCISPGTYTVKVEVEGITQNYEILNPQDYATMSEADYVYNEMVFEIEPLAELKAYILNPRDFQNFIEGDTISLTGYAGRYINNSMVKIINTMNIEEFNDAKNWITPDELRETLSSQMVEIVINETINEFEFIDPIQLNNFNITSDVTFKWYDDFVDADERQYPINFLGEGKNFEVSGLEVGYHTITLKILDEINKDQTSVELHFWISTLEQPSVPYVMQFCENVDLDGNIIFNWDRSISNFNGVEIDHYEAQKSNLTAYFHPGTGTPYIEGVDYLYIPANQTYNYFTGLEPSTNLNYYEDGKYWFRVRAVDKRGGISFWSNPVGITVNDPPNNVTCSGIYSGGSRVDFQTDYQSQNGEIILNSKPAELQYEEIMKNRNYYDYFEEQFGNEDLRYNFSYAFFTQQPIIYQYQDFTINFTSNSGRFDYNEDNEYLIFYVYSDYDGLIFKGTGFSESNPISWKDDIRPYLMFHTGENFPTLSPYLHSLTIVVRDNYNISYQLPSLLLNVTYIEPEWQNIVPQGIPGMFFDGSGDEKMDWDQYGIEWEYPHFNQYMPNQTLAPEDEPWENEEYKLLFWEIEVFFEYGDSNYTEVITQTNPEPRHYWYYTNDIVDDSISPWGLISGNYSFRVRAVDCNFIFSEWSDNATILNTTGDPLTSPFDKKLPILLNENNPPPCAWIDFAEQHGIYVIETGEEYNFNGLNSSDLNGDSLSFTWKFDGVVRDDLLPDFDPYQANITINPEWIGNDIDVLTDETDLSDEDNYGDFGEHTITLEVSDGVSITAKTIDVLIIPRNFVPTFDIAYTGGTMNQGMLEIWQGYSLSLSLDNLIHYDNEVDLQNISVTILKENIGDEQIENTKSFTINSEEINQNANLLNFGYMEEQGYTYYEDLDQFGLFNYTYILDDGEESINKSIIVHVLEDEGPEQLTAELLDIAGNDIFGDSSYITVPGQHLILNFDWVHIPEYEILDIEVESSDHDFTVNSYENSKQIDLAASNMIFNTPGSKIITVTITDRGGNSTTTSLHITVMVPTIFSEYMTNPVESSIHDRIQGAPNYDNLNRRASDVPNWFMRLGDDNPETGESYYINDEIETSSLGIPSAEYLRIWFQLDSRNEDVLEFYDSSENLIWTIRRTITYSDLHGEYQYKDTNGNWQILPQMSFLDNSNLINSNNRLDWKVNVDDRLVYVVIPDDTFSIKWKTGGRDLNNYFSRPFINDVRGLEGFKIAYIEAWAEKSLGLLNPLEISIRKVIDKLGGPNSIAGKLFSKAWSACIEGFKLSAFEHIDSLWIRFVDHQINHSKIENLKFGIEIKYNLFTGHLVIEGKIDYEIKNKKIAQIIQGLTISGSIKLVIDCLTGTIYEFSLGVNVDLSKSYGIIDILLKIPTTRALGIALQKYDNFARRYSKIGIPRVSGVLTFTLSFSLRGGWRRGIGSFLDVGMGAFASLTIIFNMIKISVGISLDVNCRQNKKPETDLSIFASLSIKINPRYIVNKWWVPNRIIFRALIRREI